jgi:two-component system, OmpR family, sensor kinase
VRLRGRSGGRIGAALRAMSLRARLLLVLAVLSAAGLLAADVATYAALRSSLFKRVDNSLDSSANAVSGVLARQRPDGPGREGPFGLNGLAALGVLTPGMYVEIRPAGGSPPVVGTVGRPGETAPTLKIPSGFGPAGDGRPRRATVQAEGGAEFRLLARRVPFSNSTLILGTPLHETHVTLDQLRWIELLVTCAVIASLLLFGLWLITASLKPLRRIEETAAAIGAGDLSRRVQPGGGATTEIGRLGMALNAMLGQIEDAFAERSASEARLRRFISDASHELRTPIAAVSAYAELFDRGARDRPADLERSMTGIQRETRRMGLLVGDLLLLARLDQGRPLESAPVDLSALAADAVDAAHAMEPERPLTLETAAAVTVAGDAERLRQVVDNLLANVRAHTPGEAAAVVRVRRDDGDVVLEVEDQGPGLADERAAHVFERFYRGDASRSRDHGGAGLGLAIVAAIVQAHGGSVGLESTPGAGTTFRITLPGRRPPELTRPERASSLPSAR